ncbi:hypothetical protein BC829DRAFT_405586 [Chytridium lagenaria]|nr:hypothetical protein BC829DRAFT_405586 [Chytridium lagenaria]
MGDCMDAMEILFLVAVVVRTVETVADEPGLAESSGPSGMGKLGTRVFEDETVDVKFEGDGEDDGEAAVLVGI